MVTRVQLRHDSNSNNKNVVAQFGQYITSSQLQMMHLNSQNDLADPNQKYGRIVVQMQNLVPGLLPSNMTQFCQILQIQHDA
jgi:hypothetical protein